MATKEADFNYQFDLGILSMYDTNNIEAENDGDDKPKVPQALSAAQKAKLEHDLLSRTTTNINLLYSKLMDIRRDKEATNLLKKDELQMHDFAISKFEVQLPEPVTRFPRQRRVPDARRATRWEKFAKEQQLQIAGLMSTLIMD